MIQASSRNLKCLTIIACGNFSLIFHEAIFFFFFFNYSFFSFFFVCFILQLLLLFIIYELQCVKFNLCFPSSTDTPKSSHVKQKEKKTALNKSIATKFKSGKKYKLIAYLKTEDLWCFFFGRQMYCNYIC